MNDHMPFAFALGQPVRWLERSDTPAIEAKRRQPFRVVAREWREQERFVPEEWYLIRPINLAGDWFLDRPVRVHRTALAAWEVWEEEEYEEGRTPALPFTFALGQQVRWCERSDVPAHQARRQHCWVVIAQEWRNHLDEGQSEWYLIRLATTTGDGTYDRPMHVHRSALSAWEEHEEDTHHG